MHNLHKPTLSQAQAARLIKLLGMLGSDHDGEVAAAGRYATKLINQANLTWADIIAVKHALQQRFPKVGAHQYERSIHAALRDGAGILSRWETDFLRDLIGRHKLTDKQATKLSQIIYKVAQGAEVSSMTAALSAPHTKAGRLQRACLDILREHEAAGALPTSGRFIYYELVQAGIVAKKKKKRTDGKVGRRTDQDTIDALFYLRDRGVAPWWWLVDETRTVHERRYAASVRDYLADTVSLARMDLWGGEPPPFIITESRSLAGVLYGLADEYLCPVSATNGQCGGHLRTEVAPRLVEGQRVLYLGDYDWQGGQIEGNTRRVLEGLAGGLDWARLAVTADEVKGPPALPIISKPDRRYRPVRYHDAVETEALSQTVIVDIVRSHLDRLLPEPLEDVQERERQQRTKLTRLLAKVRP